MALKVKHDGSGEFKIRERCCMCRKTTPYWYTPNDVAMCQECAKVTKKADVPTKKEWWDKEVALSPKPFYRPHW